MKIIIGISSITLIGVLYSIIKKFFSPKKMIEGINNNNQQIVSSNNSKIVEGNTFDNTELLTKISKHLENLNNTQKNISEMYTKHYNIEHQYLSESLISSLFSKTRLLLSSSDVSISDDAWIYPLGDDDTSGFRTYMDVCEITLISACIPKGADYTKWVDITIDEIPVLFSSTIKNNREGHTIFRVFLDNSADDTNNQYTHTRQVYSKNFYLSRQNINKLTIKFYNHLHDKHDMEDRHFSLELYITELTDIGKNYIELLERQIERNTENREELINREDQIEISTENIEDISPT